LLRGRCRHCHQPIAWRYPAVEFATTALFLLSFLQFGFSVMSLGMAVLCFLLLGLAVMDAETMRLPDAFTLPGIALGIAYSEVAAHFRFVPGAFTLPWRHFEIWDTGKELQFPFLEHGIPGFVMSTFWAALAALFLLAIRWLYSLIRHQEGLGMGDVKLLGMIAAWLGPELTILTIFLGTLAAAIYGVVMVMFSRGRYRFRSARLPFGSFLCAAALYAIFAGSPIITWYLKFFQ
jgi:leader peptidase (prepilin peptidase)/N-methyltransferase